MKLSGTIALSAIVVLLGASASPAQDTKPAASPPAASSDTKSSVSKACTDLANAKGLHGQERKKFRARCKKNGGKEG